MAKHTYVRTLIAATALCAASTAQAQQPGTTVSVTQASRWFLEVGFGSEASIQGNINSGAIGTLNNQATVILPNTYGDVYGTGINLRFGGGYMLDDMTEIRGTFIFQSADADLVPMGDIGVSRLYGQYSSYQTFGLEVGLRKYFPFTISGNRFKAYGDGDIGLGFIDRTNITLAAPTANFIKDSQDFYDKTAAFSIGFNGGVFWQMTDHMGFFGQVGLRHLTGQNQVDQLIGTGLESINDHSDRTTIPIAFGVRWKF